MRELVRELEQRLNTNQPMTNEERQQTNYLQRLQQNTLQSAERNYTDRYGSLTEDNPNKGKGMSGGVIALLVVGGVVIIGLVSFLLLRNRKKKF
ncbi:MAG: transmembrane domain-containing protein [Mollicutes bacterium UO1]